ncbi:nitroreductase [Streptococcus pneumoniae]|nr:nitroreductase [Streptococcus pneumoniae]
MKFLELNKKRHATKHFTDKPVDPKDVRTAIELQPWRQAPTTASLGNL